MFFASNTKNPGASGMWPQGKGKASSPTSLFSVTVRVPLFASPSPSPSMSFTVNFCRNWDGGEQERDTAVAAIKAVFPNASIEINRKNSYPIQVSIVNNSTDEVIWKGSQKNLFKKYNAKRTKAISEIKAGLEKLK
jgi:hypothetical protein